MPSVEIRWEGLRLALCPSMFEYPCTELEQNLLGQGAVTKLDNSTRNITHCFVRTPATGLAASHELVGGLELSGLFADPVTDREPIVHCRFEVHI